jgi:dihydrodipicolinate synthase/N-acetylneuraminate lyase
MGFTDAIRGMLLPLPTVFDGQGAVDEPVMRDLTQFYVGKGVQSLFVLGSYGQGPALDTADRMRVAQLVVEEVRGRVPVVVHIGAVDPYTSIELGVHARGLGVEAVAMVGPYYYADRNEGELVLHFEMVDRAVQLPLFVYNNPRYQGYAIGPELMLRLHAAAPRIFGAKLAMGSLDDALKYVHLVPGFATFALATALVEGMPLGVRGTVSPPLTLAPELGVDLIRAIDAGRTEEATKLQVLVTEVNDELIRLMRLYGRTPYAEGMRALGFKIKQYPRWPTVALPEEEHSSLLSLLSRARGAAVA